VRACDVWLRDNRAQLGDRPLLLTGERHAESASRARLPAWAWRFGARGWDVAWHRPVVDLAWHQVVRMSVEAGVPIHPGYLLQGETGERMLDPARDERGRARLSCVCCIFSSQTHIAAALRADPASVGPLVAVVQQFERETGMTWQQRGGLLPTLEIERHAAGAATGTCDSMTL
jgi:hypothetical protein